MKHEKEIIDLLDELKSYLKTQKSFGLYSVGPAENKISKNKIITNKAEMQVEVNDMTIDTIRIDDQLNIFDSNSKKQTLEEIRKDLGICTRCKLHRGRTNIVFGEGNPKARLIFVGEGPGRDEDEQGKPFVGRAGKLLTKIINAMGLERSDVYICNVIKCIAPENRNPELDEVTTCEPFLFKQIRSIEPEVIVCLGSVAASCILKTKIRLGEIRNKFHSFAGAKLMITYHPAALLRNPNFRRPLWDDMKMVMDELGLPIKGD